MPASGPGPEYGDGDRYCHGFFKRRACSVRLYPVEGDNDRKTVEAEIAGATVLNIVLHPDSEMLEETIVVAYGTATRSSFTGSASSVDSDKLAERSVSNVSTALSGQMSGVQVVQSSGKPGEDATIRIRGIGSMSASNNPLYILDGVPYDGSISNINPADIESMTVLKDAAANAIYGARGANGVILITTRKGKTGDAKVTVDAKWGSNRRAIPNYDVIDNPGLYYELMYKALYNSQISAGLTSAEAYRYADNTMFNTSNGGVGYQVFSVPTGEKLIGTNFKLNPNATLGYSDGEFYYIPDDWYDEIFGKGNLRQEYNATVSGSTEKINYYASFGYLDDNGLVNNSGFSRYTGRGKVDYQAHRPRQGRLSGQEVAASRNQHELQPGHLHRKRQRRLRLISQPLLYGEYGSTYISYVCA